MPPRIDDFAEQGFALVFAESLSDNAFVWNVAPEDEAIVCAGAIKTE